MAEAERDIIWLPQQRPSPRQIIAEVAQRRGLTLEDLMGPSRLKRITRVRQEAMWELRQRTKLSFPQIARRLGRTNHTTALHAFRRHEERLAEAQGRAA